jgi:hypothetical protein
VAVVVAPVALEAAAGKNKEDKKLVGRQGLADTMAAVTARQAEAPDTTDKRMLGPACLERTLGMSRPVELVAAERSSRGKAVLGCMGLQMWGHPLKVVQSLELWEMGERCNRTERNRLRTAERILRR